MPPRSTRPSPARCVAIASRAYRIDTNLRPEGRSGVLVRSVDSYVAYWERWARPWEFQALLKARHSAGDAATGSAVRKGRRRAPLVAALRRRRARRAAHDEGEGGGDRRHAGASTTVSSSGAAAASGTWSSPCSSCNWSTAGRDPALRLRATLPAPRRACRRRLRGGRGRGGPGHRLPVPAHRRAPSPARRGGSGPHRARPTASRGTAWRGCSGSAGGPEETPGERFDAVLARHQGAGRAIHERLFFRPLLEAFAVGTARPGRAAPGASNGYGRPASRPTPPRSGSPPSASPTPSGPARR